jgi:pimeloyl-ACP methyl ester carboxylesterase
VYALDRRGRGGSGDAKQYAIELEFEDIEALINSIKEPVFLLGHSYGALCSLEAALRTTHLRKLILYEPPIPTGMEIYPHEVVSRIQTLLDAGDRLPTLLLLGGDSPAFFKTAIGAVHAALPKSQVVVMPGQQHTAMHTARNLATHGLQIRAVRLTDCKSQH